MMYFSMIRLRISWKTTVRIRNRNTWICRITVNSCFLSLRITISLRACNKCGYL